jgi:murein DD-endopeptidase MepM/ murein hydrolase activator NlpD
MPAVWNLDQLLDNALDQSLGQFGEQFSFLPDWFSAPLQSNWHLWIQPSSTQPSLTQPNPDQSAIAQSAQSALLPLEQALAAPQLGRDMRKLPSLAQPSLSLPTIPAQPVATAAALKTLKTPAKPVLYDTTALLAMNCTQDQLTHYSGDSVIDPASAKRMGWINLLFPLPIAAVLTSAFGWRVHPISGALSFHTGLDMGAPMGTPVLAAAAGRVMVADQMGGYGLAVVVEAGNQRNLYGHLSGIAVQPGTQVAQGTILGWVGSTGNSTGPHLHFESQVATSNGWTAVNPIATATLAAAGQ